MKRLLFILVAGGLAAFGLGCPGGGKNDGGPTDGDVDPEDIEITVSGTARVHPVAAGFMADAGLPPLDLEGLTLNVEEPFKVALATGDGVFGAVTLSDAGTFSVSKVPVAGIILGVAAGIRDDSDAGVSGRRVVRAATTLFDVALEGGKPDTDIVNGKAYALPTAFHERLTQAIGESNIRRITGYVDGGPAGKRTLIEAGCIVGQVVDASGKPVSAAVVDIAAIRANQVFYPTADLTSTQAQTSANGLFVYVHNADPSPSTFDLKIAGDSRYLTRKAGSVADACLVMTVYPGKVIP